MLFDLAQVFVQQPHVLVGPFFEASQFAWHPVLKVAAPHAQDREPERVEMVMVEPFLSGLVEAVEVNLRMTEVAFIDKSNIYRGVVVE